MLAAAPLLLLPLLVAAQQSRVQTSTTYEVNFEEVTASALGTDGYDAPQSNVKFQGALWTNWTRAEAQSKPYRTALNLIPETQPFLGVSRATNTTLSDGTSVPGSASAEIRPLKNSQRILLNYVWIGCTQRVQNPDDPYHMVDQPVECQTSIDGRGAEGGESNYVDSVQPVFGYCGGLGGDLIQYADGGDNCARTLYRYPSYAEGARPDPFKKYVFTVAHLGNDNSTGPLDVYIDKISYTIFDVQE